jgi:hypothetical protein
MSRTIVAALCLLGTLSLPACRQKQTVAATSDTRNTTAVTTAQPLTPEQLGELGAQIRKEPARGEEILAQHHLTHEAFEKAIRAVTEDAAASKRYAEAYRKASA